MALSSPVVAFGPGMPGWGSWEWVGADLLRELSKYYRTVSFGQQPIPPCDVLVVVKHALPYELVERISRHTAVLYCPIDFYGSAAEIDADGMMLRKCSRIIVHCERLRRYFEPYAPVEYLDHHVKFVTPMWTDFLEEGYVLWVGVRTNLPPLVEWANAHPLPEELRILTNPEDPITGLGPKDISFQGKGIVNIQPWNSEEQIQLTAGARGALDIKGTDFRSRHKPPAKAIDFIASGVRLAMNPDSSPVEHLARMGFAVASPQDRDQWFSRAYWEETRQFGGALRELLSIERIGWRLRRIIEEVMTERKKV